MYGSCFRRRDACALCSPSFALLLRHAPACYAVVLHAAQSGNQRKPLAVQHIPMLDLAVVLLASILA